MVGIVPFGLICAATANYVSKTLIQHDLGVFQEACAKVMYQRALLTPGSYAVFKVNEESALIFVRDNVNLHPTPLSGKISEKNAEDVRTRIHQKIALIPENARLQLGWDLIKPQRKS